MTTKTKTTLAQFALEIQQTAPPARSGPRFDRELSQLLDQAVANMDTAGRRGDLRIFKHLDVLNVLADLAFGEDDA